MTLLVTFRHRLTEAVKVKNAGTPLKVIAYRAGCSIQHLGKLLHGQRDNPTIKTVEALAKATGVSMTWLLGLEE